MSEQRLKLVLDTNVFLVSLASNHRYSWIYDTLLENKYDLCVSTEILLEYEEIISQKYGLKSTLPILEGLLLLPNIHLITPHFNWNLLKDVDDNKFADCAVSCGADYIISNDKGFNQLREITFPPISILTYPSFEETYKSVLIN